MDTIVLLADQDEYGVFAPALYEHNEALKVVLARSAEELMAYDAGLLAGARLIAFASSVIVPVAILAALGHGAYNFHPGPPAYPGIAPAHFALYDRAVEFGTTLHVMTERVDDGAILDAQLFPIVPGTTIVALEAQTYSVLVRQFFAFADVLAAETGPTAARPSIPWGHRKTTRRLYRSMCDIPLDISQDDLDRRMQAFGANRFGMVPTITLHGVQFRATLDPASDSSA
ncbi:formyltransferase family protein [Bradyrhizobium sp. STM 3809]|uniref:formyltransferase family protein n=1 Tax=Bradyrhizobium sp. STM 3809 TaxID=551936 RepID=UPI00024081CE|nr:formyltransferase family protein [Bradyrhizobium sp. STM 3809]CCE03047.1 conserved hypothetical protein [Bradyrhizobium sp. STM 3809]